MLRTDVGPVQEPDPPGGGQPRVRDRGGGTLLRLLRCTRRDRGSGLVRLRRRHLAGLQPELELLRGRWLRAGSPQETWLRADLAANPRTCVAAIWHHPLFSSGEHGNNSATRALWNALYDAGADVVINGHDHDYERFAPQRPDGTADSAKGIREFVVGTGGVGLRPFATKRANSQVRKSTVLGVMRFELKASSYTWRFMPVAGSTWTDTGTTACH